MKKFKRMTALTILLCMILSMLPPIQLAQAAEVSRRYELDTDGIDPGATYLIANSGVGTAAGISGRILRRSSATSTSPTNQQVTFKEADGIPYVETGFSNEELSTFVFQGTASNGTVTQGIYGLRVSRTPLFVRNNTEALQFSHQGGGAYQIYNRGASTTSYLWYTGTSWGRTNQAKTVYLYKLIEPNQGVTVRFDANGGDVSVLPEDQTSLPIGTSITVPAPKGQLVKEDAAGVWEFLCWNTDPNGIGERYAPGELLTVTQDLTLYVEWELQTKYKVTFITAKNGVPTSVEEISGVHKKFFVQLEGDGDTYIPMTEESAGVYSTKVKENGIYKLFEQVDGGEYTEVHGHQVNIEGSDGQTECQHFTLTYNTKGGAWAEGKDPGVQIYHAVEPVALTGDEPTLAGNRFLGWKDQNGNIYAAGATIPHISEATTLTAQWEKTVSVSVNVTIAHKPAAGGMDQTDTRDDVSVQVMRTDENGYNHTVGIINLSEENYGNYQYTYDSETNTTRYTLPEGQVTLTDLQKGDYTAAVAKSHYEVTVTSQMDSEGNVTVEILLQYNPSSFDLNFAVQVENWDKVPQNLRPQAVNIKVNYWGYNDQGELGWHTITQQDGAHPPVTVTLDTATGKGHGFYPVWCYWSSDDGVDHPYYYRIFVSSYVMPDGSIEPANQEQYTTYSAGIYTGTVTIEPSAGKPDYPEGSEGLTALTGAIYDPQTQKQDAMPTLTVAVTPFTVTLNAVDGKVNGQQKVVLQNQYRYPDLSQYEAISNTGNALFIGWYDEAGNSATELTGKLLQGNVVMTASYSDNGVLIGQVQVETEYQLDKNTMKVPVIDRPEQVVVLLCKQVAESFITVDSQKVSVTYEKNARYGTAEYRFEGIVRDGTVYYVQVMPANFVGTYDNNLDGNYDPNENQALLDAQIAEAELNVLLQFQPERYTLGIHVDASAISEGMRPTGVLSQLLYRDQDDIHNYHVMTDHTVAPYGVEMPMDNMGFAAGHDDVWIRHTDGAYYEYQLQLYKLYGNVEGAYTAEGVEFTQESPFYVEYGAPNDYVKQSTNGENTLTATLKPKTYQVILDLNLGTDTQTPVRGMDYYMIDDGTGNISYAYTHTWSYKDQFVAFPYRDGYVFMGWEEVRDSGIDELVVDNGTVYVGANLSRSVTLVAQWEPLTGTDYTIRYLELNTDKVLHGAQAVTGATAGERILANEAYIAIEGYEYAGAMVNGVYSYKTENPYLTVTNDPLKNLMVIYYLPDESSGYTEQVESNMGANKTAVLEDNGTYTITLDTYTTDDPITTKISKDTPMDIILVLDQSGSMYSGSIYYPSVLDDLKESVEKFIEMVNEHGRENAVDHRIAVVGYASDQFGGVTRPSYPTAGKDGYSQWCNTGVFDSNGQFHVYPVTGFVYEQYDGQIEDDGTYYTKTSDGEYLLLTYHQEYRDLITEAEARESVLRGEKVYGNVTGVGFVELTRNSSGLWLYGDKLLYSRDRFFTLYTDVWTHREGIGDREIHAFGTGENYRELDDHSGIYTRTEVRDDSYDLSVYQDALVPVSTNEGGAGGITPGLQTITENIGANGLTYVSYGMEMAREILKANPVEEGDNRIQFVVVFTDGKPGDSSNFDETEANRALKISGDIQMNYGAEIYAIGLYGTEIVSTESDQDYFMNGLSSNYPEAVTLDDVWKDFDYAQAQSGYRLNNGGPYYVRIDGNVYPLSLKATVEYMNWGYTDSSGKWVQISSTPVSQTNPTTSHPVIVNGQVEGHTILRKYGVGYKETPNSGYYVVAENAASLKDHFADIVQELTTKVTTEISLKQDTIMRDFLNQGLVLTDGTEITVYLQEGRYNPETGNIGWSVNDEGLPVLEELVSLSLGQGNGDISATDPISGVTIYAKNLNAENPTNPYKANYQPHQVDITGYNYSEWFINERKHIGYKMVVKITRVEATDDVQWSRSTATNLPQSGIWLPKTAQNEESLLLPFNQPSTIFVERAYVLDYGKQFTLSGWYFDDEDGKDAMPIHVDCNIANGMNWFDPADPNTKNIKGGTYGNLKYGNVQIADGAVTYTPTTMNWGGYDQFYVFGNTWRKTVLAQDANQNGNLWNKVTVIPANNIYYEDSFLTTESTTQNGIDGFTFTGAWEVVEGTDAGKNVENPEQGEATPNGAVHGWTDSLADDKAFTDGSAHGTGFNKETGASAEFNFTGTGVDVYTRTNLKSGMVVAVLSRISDGKVQTVKSIAMDNLAASGDYYHIPTVSFMDLVYGTYSVKLIATATATATDEMRYEYYIDGIRVYNPLGSTTNYQSDIVKDAYGLETNAVFTEIRDVLLDYGDFNTGMSDDQLGKMGAVFIDWVQPGQEGEGDLPGQELPNVTGQPTYNLGTFEAYGPKNEVYLTSGQAIVVKVDESNTYYVGLKSLTGSAVKANLSGLTQANPTVITLEHTTDMYYRVTPVDGYIVIQNGNQDGAILSITDLRTTNMVAPAENGGILPLTEEEAVVMVRRFARYIAQLPEPEPEETPDNPGPEETMPDPQQQILANQMLANALFASVRQWLSTSEGV